MSLFKTSVFVISLCISSYVFGSTPREDDRDLAQRMHDVEHAIQSLHSELLESPIKNRKFGLEMSPIRMLALNNDKSYPISYSGGLSYFNHSRGMEIAIPVFYEEHRAYSDAPIQTTVDLHVRSYFGRSVRGFFVSVLARFAYLRGIPYDYEYMPLGDVPLATKKFGVGVGMGYRMFSKSGLYWGASLNGIRYLSGKHKIFGTDNLLESNDRLFVLDLEFLKLGYAF